VFFRTLKEKIRGLVFPTIIRSKKPTLTISSDIRFSIKSGRFTSDNHLRFQRHLKKGMYLLHLKVLIFPTYFSPEESILL